MNYNDWQKEFDKRFGDIDVETDYSEYKMKNFIKELLTSQVGGTLQGLKTFIAEEKMTQNEKRLSFEHLQLFWLIIDTYSESIKNPTNKGDTK